jgi:hypothetical protein
MGIELRQQTNQSAYHGLKRCHLPFVSSAELEKLEATLLHIQAAATDAEV